MIVGVFGTSVLDGVAAIRAASSGLVSTGIVTDDPCRPRRLYTLKKVLEHAVHRMGIVVEWDPSTPPAVRDRFAIVSLSALQWSFGGAALGLMIGVFTERPALWAGGGAAIAAIVGGVQGHEAVESGWRLRGYHNEQGVECAEVIVRALPKSSS